jgi:hypothetical protein
MLDSRTRRGSLTESGGEMIRRCVILSCKTAEGKSDASFLYLDKRDGTTVLLCYCLLRYRDTYDTSDTCGTSTVVGSTKRVSPWA